MAPAKKILIVEDNPVNMEPAKDILESHGYEVFSATNGLKAIQQTHNVEPNLILMGLQLPGMSGLEVSCRHSVSHEHR